jgi:hypothetical protein
VVRDKARAAGAEGWPRDLPDLAAFPDVAFLDVAFLDPVERVSTGLPLTQVGLRPAGREMLAAADYACGAR